MTWAEVESLWTEAQDQRAPGPDLPTDPLASVLAAPGGPAPGDPGYPRTPWTTFAGDEPRDLAFAFALHESLVGRPLKPSWFRPHFWNSERYCASPLEAWNFDLHPERNPGDHSALPALSNEQLSTELHLAATLQPQSPWVIERGAALEAEYHLRKQENRV